MSGQRLGVTFLILAIVIAVPISQGRQQAPQGLPGLLPQLDKGHPDKTSKTTATGITQTAAKKPTKETPKSDEQRMRELFAELLSNKTRNRAEIVRALRQLPSKKRDALVLKAYNSVPKKLNDWEAVTALGAPQSPEATRFLNKMAKDSKSQNVRFEALQSVQRHIVIVGN